MHNPDSAFLLETSVNENGLDLSVFLNQGQREPDLLVEQINWGGMTHRHTMGFQVLGLELRKGPWRIMISNYVFPLFPSVADLLEGGGQTWVGGGAGGGQAIMPGPLPIPHHRCCMVEATSLSDPEFGNLCSLFLLLPSAVMGMKTGLEVKGADLVVWWPGQKRSPF